ADRLAHALRQHPAERRRLREAPLGEQQAHDLADEEGIALRHAMHLRGHARGRRRAEDLGDVALDVRLAEAAEEDARAERLAGEVAEDLREGMLPAELDVAIRADEEEM